MKTLKIISLLLVPFLIQIVISCCNCDPTEETPYVHCSFGTNHLDNTGGAQVVSLASSISKTDYGIQLLVNRKEYTCSVPNQSFSLFNSAYACSCAPENSYKPTNTINEIIIYTINDFDASHPAGSDVTEYFMAAHYSDLVSLPEYINQFDPVLYSDASFNASQFNQGIINLILETAPTLGVQHQFEIQILLSDGQLHEEQTAVIDLI